MSLPTLDLNGCRPSLHSLARIVVLLETYGALIIVNAGTTNAPGEHLIEMGMLMDRQLDDMQRDALRSHWTT